MPSRFRTSFFRTILLFDHNWTTPLATDLAETMACSTFGDGRGKPSADAVKDLVIIMFGYFGFSPT